MKNEIIIYTTDTCSYCIQTKNFLQDQGLEYHEINVQEDLAEAQKLFNETGQVGVPQIKVNGYWVLGFDPQGIMTFVN